MVVYQKSELISATNLAKRFGHVMQQITQKSVEKIGVLKNNKLEAVVISTEEYERLKDIEAMHQLSENIPDDLSMYTDRIKKGMASKISEKTHEEIFEDLAKRYGT